MRATLGHLVPAITTPLLRAAMIVLVSGLAAHASASGMDCSGQPDGSACDDGDAETLGEACYAWVCGAALALDDATARPARSKPARVSYRGSFRPGALGPSDVVDPSEGFQITIFDGLMMFETRALLASECISKPKGKIDCVSADKASRIRLGPDKDPSRMTFDVRLKNLGFTNPLLGPLFLVITQGTLERGGSNANCTGYAAKLACKD